MSSDEEMEDDLFLCELPPPPPETEIAALRAEVSEVVQPRVGITSFFNG